MKKTILFFLLLSIITSCSAIKNTEEIIEYKQDLSKIDYSFWGFNGNGKNSNPNKFNWDTQRIEFSKNSLISDGIYENSGRFTSERAFVKDGLGNINKSSFAVKFKFQKGYPKKKTTLPIIVKGRSYRCIKVIATSKNTIKVLVRGNNMFAIPNEDIKMDEILLKANDFNTLYVSWDIENHLFYIAINDEKPQTIKIPIDFRWNKCIGKWTIQDYSTGKAFKGELDYFLVTNQFLNRKSMKELIKNHL